MYVRLFRGDRHLQQGGRASAKNQTLDPSPDSAGYDLNKIIRTEYDEPLYAEMGQRNHFEGLLARTNISQL